MADRQDVADELAATALTMARRFAAGATLWCAGPDEPSHAQHLAVEFVHPVVVGARSLPAGVIDASRHLVDTARLQCRPGDLLALIGDGEDPVLADLVQRATAWGVTTVFVATMNPDAAVAADHVVRAPYDDAGPVLSYHLLWELVHVVFEHPGLLSNPDAVCRDDICITCSDEGRIAEVQSLIDDRTVLVRAGGEPETVDVSVVDAVTPGELLLVHAGLALAVVEGAVA